MDNVSKYQDAGSQKGPRLGVGVFKARAYAAWKPSTFGLPQLQKKLFGPPA